MKISIVTPSYNQSAYLQQTIDSVRAIGHKLDVEHIIVDGGSTDGTLEILKNAGDQVRWISEPDKGQADAVNKGVNMASGEIIGWLNSDDLYLQGALETVHNHFTDHDNCQWLYGRCLIIDEHGEEILKWITMYKNMKLRDFSKSRLLTQNYISQPSVFFRKDLFEKVGGMDLSLHFALDYDLWLRFATVAPACVIDDELAAFRRHSESKSETDFEIQFREQFKVSCRYDTSAWLRWRHRANNAAIVSVYNILSRIGS